MPTRLTSCWLVILFAWVLFVASLFLPATNELVVPGHDHLLGWQAALTSLSMYSFWGVVMTLADPRFALLWFCPWFNLAMLLAPILVFHHSENARRLASLLCLGPIGAIGLAWLVTRDLYVGFYVWSASFGIMSFGCWWYDREYSRYSDRFPA
ncbi:MAG: hypothetical protein JNL96_22840 [Planctomycetaceae bacterium]|nr:hypothetical protein [Planctomycetaceae bacterium]